jgi:hypothetical protein
MKTRYKAIIIGGVVIVSLFAISGIVQPNPLWLIYQCHLDLIPNADALIVHQTIGQTYNRAEVVVVGTITESFPCFYGDRIVTRMTVDVEEYLKNPLGVDAIRLESRGGFIPGVVGIWVEDAKIFEHGERVLLFLYEPANNVYKISPYSTSIGAKNTSGIDLIKGIELRADDNRITLSKGESANIALLLDSFFGYDKVTPVSVSSFALYDSDTDDSTLFEDPSDLEKFGIHIKPAMITPNVNGTAAFDLPITIDADAIDGKYSVNLIAQTQEQTETTNYSWKLSHKQIQVMVENEN